MLRNIRDRSDQVMPRGRQFAVIEAAVGAGASVPGSENGPEAFRRYVEDELAWDGAAAAWHAMPDGVDRAGDPPLARIASVARWIAGETRRRAAARERFVVVGGDHSCAIGTWSGVADALRGEGPLGLVWIDAHMDMHVPETSHSGAIHGMPVACLLGYGFPELISLAGSGPALAPRHLCLVGARSFESEEVDFAKRHGVRVIGMADVARRGVAAALDEARTIAARGTAGYGVSLDLDVFDPQDAPGVGTPEADGIRAAEFMESWAVLVRDPACIGIEIVEYNPSRDRAQRTAKLLAELVEAFV
jgi:arginase